MLRAIPFAKGVPSHTWHHDDDNCTERGMRRKKWNENTCLALAFLLYSLFLSFFLVFLSLVFLLASLFLSSWVFFSFFFQFSDTFLFVAVSVSRLSHILHTTKWYLWPIASSTTTRVASPSIPLPPPPPPLGSDAPRLEDEDGRRGGGWAKRCRGVYRGSTAGIISV